MVTAQGNSGLSKSSRYLVIMSDSKHRSSSSPSRGQGSPPVSPSASAGKAASSSRASHQVPHGEKTTEDNKSGRVAFDSKGNPVWEWQTAPGVYEQDVTTQRLKKLEAPELSLASTQPVPIIGKKSAEKTKSKEDTGFNPYDSDVPMRPRTDRKAASHPALVHKKPPSLRRSQPEQPKPESVWDKFKSKFS